MNEVRDPITFILVHPTVFGYKFSGFRPVVLLYLDKDKHGSLTQWYWQRKAEGIREKPLCVPHNLSNISPNDPWFEPWWTWWQAGRRPAWTMVSRWLIFTVHKTPVSTSMRTYHLSIIQTMPSLFFGEIITVYSQNLRDVQMLTRVVRTYIHTYINTIIFVLWRI
jgi:hypothetical protein